MAAKTEPKQNKTDDNEWPDRDSRQVPAWHVAVLSVCSFATYNIYWIYKILSQLRASAQLCAELSNNEKPSYEVSLSQRDLVELAELKREGRDAMMRLENNGTKDSFLSMSSWPVAMFALVFAVPIANMIVLMRAAAQVFSLLPEQTSPLRINAKFAAFVTALAYGGLVLLGLLPGRLVILYLATCLPLVFVQICLNKFWKVYESDKLLVRQAFNPLELGLIICGSTILALILFSKDILGH